MPQIQGIAHGFPGQRLVVLPGLVREQMRSHPLLRGLLVTDAGIFHNAKSHYIERNHGTSTNLLIACLAGKGWIRVWEGPVLAISPGMVAWLPANLPHSYGADADDPWTIEWVHFEGQEVDSWRELLGISLEGGTLRLNPTAVAELRLGTIWSHLDQGYTLANLAAAGGVLRAALAAVSQRNSPRQDQQTAEERVASSIAWMKGHLAEPIRLGELASHSGLSVPHYTVLFRRQTGFSPIDWFSRLRVKWACELLDTTQSPVAEIARQVGFSDPYYFTRCFRRVVGLPPRKYRRVPKG